MKYIPVAAWLFIVFAFAAFVLANPDPSSCGLDFPGATLFGCSDCHEQLPR